MSTRNHMWEVKAERIHSSNRTALSFGLLLWVIAIAFMLFLDLPKDEGNLFYKPISAIMLLPILVYGILNIWFGLIRDLGIHAIIKTTVALLFGGMGLYTIAESPNTQQHFLIAIPGYLVLMSAVWFYHAKISKKHDREAPFSMDASIRGFQSIVMTGNDSYRYVQRENLDSKSAAKAFEDRLIRYLEKKTGKNIFSMAGDGTNYWRINTIAGSIDFIVIGTDFNTRGKLQEKNRWILRIQEEGPAILTLWLAKHFPEDSITIRKLNNGNTRAQFASSALLSDDAFFQTEMGPLNIDDIHLKLLAALENGDISMPANQNDTNVMTDRDDKPPHTIH